MTILLLSKQKPIHKIKRLTTRVSCTTSNQHTMYRACCLPNKKTFTCGIVPCSFEMKKLYLATRKHKSNTLSVTTFSLLPRITSSFEKKKTNYISTMCKVTMKPSLHIKPVVLDFGTVPEQMHSGFFRTFTENTDRGIY